MMPGLGGGIAPNAASESLPLVFESRLNGLRSTRKLFEKLELVGVAGKTLTDACGLRLPPILKFAEPDGDANEGEREDVEEALEMGCW
jgi:hypothetical protein